jgi:hypothetical protein
MLEKYRKLAHDASLNGDRVQTEYYLQFADHYFRVVADSRSPRDEQRPRQNGEREPSSDYDYDDEEEQIEHTRSGTFQPRRDREDEDSTRSEGEPAAEGEQAVEGERVDEAVIADENPFVREPRGRRPRQRGRGAPEEAPASQGEAAFDAGILPPSIPRESEEPPKRPRGRRRTRPAEDGDSETLEAVG